MQRWILFGLLLLLAACSSEKATNPPDSPILGLLKVTITGVGEGATADAKAEWVKAGVSGQSATVIPVNGGSAVNDVQFSRRAVSFYDNDLTSTRYVLSNFDVTNRTLFNFQNLTLYAVNVPSNIGGTGIANLIAGTGSAITNPTVARSFKPVHGMRGLVQGLEVNPNWADLQLFSPTQASNILAQALVIPDPFHPPNAVLPAGSAVLEYGFVARNFSGGRAINARNTSLDCTDNSCKGTVTLAYQFPKISPRQNNPFAFVLYFVVANETEPIGSQSLEEQASNTIMGLSSFSSFSQLNTLAGSTYDFSDDKLNPLCRIKTAVSPNAYLGPDPLPSASGSLDVCFGSSGKKGTLFPSLTFSLTYGRASAIQPDGKIVVAGDSYNGTNTGFALARYNPNGSLDSSFDTDGKVRMNFGGSQGARAVVLQNDGKIVVAGFFSSVTNVHFALARYNPNGSLDTGFGSAGLVETIFNNQDSANSIALQTDGKIIVAGKTDNGSGSDFAIARYNPNGSLDTSFNSSGQTQIDFGLSSDFGTTMALQVDGKIVVGGYKGVFPNSDFALARLNANGSLDTSFGTGGKVVTAFGSSNGDLMNGLAIQADGKIVAVGSTHSPSGSRFDFALVRYNTSGSLDSTFGTGGKVTTSIGSFSDEAMAIALQSNGKIVTAGRSYLANLNDSIFALARYNTDGSLDTAFGTGGKVLTDFNGAHLRDTANSLAIQADSKILAVGTTVENQFALARYNP